MLATRFSRSGIGRCKWRFVASVRGRELAVALTSAPTAADRGNGSRADRRRPPCQVVSLAINAGSRTPALGTPFPGRETANVVPGDRLLREIPMF